MLVEGDAHKVLQCLQLINYDLRRRKSQCFINVRYTSGASIPQATGVFFITSTERIAQ